MIAKEERMPMAALDDESQKRTADHMSSAKKLESGAAEACSEFDLNPESAGREPDKCRDSIGKTKIALSFSVDRLLKCERKFENDKCEKPQGSYPEPERKCCGSVYPYCGYSSCLVVGAQPDVHQQPFSANSYSLSPSSLLSPPHCKTYQDIRSILRPTPIRAVGTSGEAVSPCFPFTSTMPNFHNQKRPNQHQIGSQFQRHDQNISLATLSTLMTPLSSLKSLQINHQASQHFRQPSTNFQSNEQNIDIPSTNSTNSSGVNIPQHNILQQQQQQQQHHHQHQQQKLASTGSLVGGVPGISGKRKRSWSRAVFSNLQRKGLEIQFQQQKYITKPDRRKLAARLNLTDAQVKVWFQNRRMKWRHTRENLKTGQEKQINSPESRWEKDETRTLEAFSEAKAEAADKREFDYLTDASSSVEMSDNEDDDEIDVVE